MVLPGHRPEDPDVRRAVTGSHGEDLLPPVTEHPPQSSRILFGLLPSGHVDTVPSTAAVG